jgi:tRNA threonylcarbamoyladenosine biosynthesis protein TsaB
LSEHSGQPILAAINARHDHVYFQVVSSNGASLIPARVAPIEEALAAARLGALKLVGNAAKILADRWPPDAAAPGLIDAKPAPDIEWVGWIGAAVVDPETLPARPYYLRAPDAKPQTSPLQKAVQPALP